jgi:hypothetical protein
MTSTHLSILVLGAAVIESLLAMVLVADIWPLTETSK